MTPQLPAEIPLPAPRIGLTTSFENGEQRLDVRYVAAIERAGGVPVLLPATRNPDVRSALLDLVDGLLIPGGPAVELGLQGALPADLDRPDPLRFEADLGYLDAALARGYPVLGICYGMQLLNARAGGSIWADVERQVPGSLTHSAGRGATRHAVRFEPGTLLERLIGRSDAEVNTRHVQALRDLAPGYRVSARAPDGVVEGIESEDGLCIGVQFHAEREPERCAGLFQYFVNKAAKRG